MTPFDPESRRDSKEQSEPVGLTGRVSHAARQRPPAPAGRGIAIALIAGVAVIAAIWQISSGGGAGESIRKQREADEQAQEKAASTPAPLASRNPAGSTTSPTPAPTEQPPSETPSEPPAEPPAESPPSTARLAIEVPPGLSAETAANLRLALGAISSGYVVGAADLPRLVAAAHPEERALVRRTVVEELTLLAVDPRTRGVALDAGLDLAGDGSGGLRTLVQVATASVRDADEAAAEALVFLDHVSAEEGEPAVSALVGLMDEPLQPLHLRVLAAGVLARWGAAAEARRTLAKAPTTPKVLVDALAAD